MGGGDGDDWVAPKEFPALICNLFYFNKLFKALKQVDADNDRRLDFAEFKAGLDLIGMNIDDVEAREEFDQMDSNEGGIVLFDEFCVWYTKKHEPSRDIATSADKFKVTRKRSKKKAGARKNGSVSAAEHDDMPNFDSKKFDALE